MEIKINKQTLKEWIEMYYKKQEGVDVKVSIRVEKGLVGFYGDEGVVVETKVTKTYNLLGSQVEETEILYLDKLTSIFKTILGETDLVLSSFAYDTSLHETQKGYGLGEYTEKTPVLRGAILRVHKRELSTNMALKRNITM